MRDDLTGAILLMVVGMLTVFVILSIVVLAGQLLIGWVNRWHRDEVPPAGQSGVPAEHIAVLTAVTHAVTGGRASSIKVEKDDA